MANKSDDKDKEIKELKKQLAKKDKELKRKEAALAELAAIMTLKKVGLDGRRFGRGSLTSESERQTILDFIDSNKNVRLSVLCKYLDISSRTIQRWRKNGLTDKRKGAFKTVPKKLSEEEVSTIYKVECRVLGFVNCNKKNMLPVVTTTYRDRRLACYMRFVLVIIYDCRLRGSTKRMFP